MKDTIGDREKLWEQKVYQDLALPYNSIIIERMKENVAQISNPKIKGHLLKLIGKKEKEG